MPHPELQVDSLQPIMRELLQILKDHHALEQFFHAIKYALRLQLLELEELNIRTPEDYIYFMNSFLSWIPTEHQDGRWVYTNIVVFYFVFNVPPLCHNADLLSQIVPSSVGKPQKPLTSWLVRYAFQVGKWLYSTDSFSEATLITFQHANRYNVDDYQGPWSTFNDFFCRKLKVPRAIPASLDDHVIVSPADCTYSSPLVDVNSDSFINVKGLLWNINGLLSDSCLPKDTFAGGKFIHAFLAPFDYHRQHAPISGIVREASVIQGQVYLQVVVEEIPNGGGKCRLRPVRPLPPPSDPDEGRALDAPDGTGYQFLQTRGAIIIENENLGYVAVLPIGMAQVSSVNMTVSVGQYVHKGDEISWFELGGSDVIMVFQQRANVNLTIDWKKSNHMTQGQQVLFANYDCYKDDVVVADK